MFRWLSNELYSWMSWIIIPFIVEIIPAIGNFIILIKKYIKGRRNKEKELDFLPQISLLIPVYNSAATLEGCIESVNNSTYPNELIDIFLINNKSKDNSFDIYVQCQEKYKTLRMQWLNAGQGKSKALNLALFNSEGKYIINIDSDGKLEEQALYNMVRKFENNKNIHCMTGIILTEPALIDETKKRGLRFLQKLEFMEYNQAFLVGRNYNSEYNNIFTLSGAFSAFRKSTILKTQLYNTNTICEDAHLTFQVKKLLKQSVALCETAIFMVDPIESVEKLYTQRQRWQIGELEVFHMFHGEKTLKYKNFFKDANIRLMCIDHTVAFPRLIWCFALIALGFYKYDMKMILTALFWIYMLYVFSAFLNYLASICFLWSYKEIRRYYAKKIAYLFVLPAYNMLTFLIRMAGIINSLNRGSSWKTLTYKEEVKIIRDTVKEDLSFRNKKKEKSKMNKRWLRFLILVVFLIINISGALYFLHRNTQNNYKNYAKMQDNLLHSIVNTTNKDVSTLVTAVGIAKTSGSQSFYIYNSSAGEFVVYKDKKEAVTDAKMEEALLKRDIIYGRGTKEQRVMSTADITIGDESYIVALGTLTSYIDSNLNTSQYNMFVITEFLILYLVLVCISLRALTIDQKHGEEMEQLESEFTEYKNKLAASAELEEQTKNTYFVEGFYSVEFLQKLKLRLSENEITHSLYSFQIAQEAEEVLNAMAKRYNVYFAKGEGKYHMLSIGESETEEEIIREIEEYGGTEIGKSV